MRMNLTLSDILDSNEPAKTKPYAGTQVSEQCFLAAVAAAQVLQPLLRPPQIRLAGQQLPLQKHTPLAVAAQGSVGRRT